MPSQEIEKLGQHFIFDIHEVQNIYLEKPIINLPENKRAGRPYTRPICNIIPIEVREYAAKLEPEDFQEIVVRETPKGSLKYNVHEVKFWGLGMDGPLL